MASTKPGQLLRLSTFNSFYAPRNYMSTVLGYSLEALGQTGLDMLVGVLRNMVAETVKTYPILAGTVQEDPQSHGMRMIAHMPDTIHPTTSAAESVMSVVDHRVDESQLSWDTLQASGFTPRMLDCTKLCTYPPSLDSKHPQPIFGVQSNLINGGILVAFQLHHAMADGHTLSQLADFMSGLLAGKGAASALELHFTLPSLEEQTQIGDPHAIVKLCEERFLTQSSGCVEAAVAPTANLAQALLITSSSNIESLRDQCNIVLQIEGERTTVSKNDVLAAYLWATITAARFRNQMQVDCTIPTSSCYIPVDVRKKVNPNITESYFGSATLMVRVQQPVATLVAAVTAMQQHKDALPLARIASSIRGSIGKVDTHYVNLRLQLAHSVEAFNHPSPGSIDEPFRSLLQVKSTFDPSKHTDVVLSTLAPIFDMDGAALEMMKPQFFRALHHASVAGVVDVVPSVRQNGKIEMTMALEGETLQALKDMEVWTSFIDKTLA